MLAKKNKLNLSKPEVRLLVRSFSRLQSEHLLLKYAVGLRAKTNAALVVVSKSASKKATLRNKIRRHCYLRIESAFSQRANLQLIVWVRRFTPLPVLLVELEDNLHRIFSRAN